ncbi:MAG: hypothetical protein PW735_01205 [Acidobacteriaceae bacterium]|nr:hypothetical protein [Acidobacteriaceae bacterium]
MNASPRKPSFFRAPSNIFWAAFAIRLLCILIGHTFRVRSLDDHFDYGFEAGRIARSLVLGHGYSSPFNGNSGPTAWLPPLYPLLMALAFKLFGIYSQGAAAFLMILDSLASALVAPAVYEIAARCLDAFGLARRNATKAAPVALWSAWAWALHPAAMQFAVHWLWETAISTTLFTWALVFALRLRGTGEQTGTRPAQARMSAWGIYGLLWGVLALSNTTLLICWPGVTAWILWPRLGFLRGWAGAALSFLLVWLCLTPWIVRNERALHAFVPARSNFGIELWNASVWYHDAIPWGTALTLAPDDAEFRQFTRMGEVRFAHMRQQQALSNIKAHPELYAKFTAYRVQYFWYIWPHAADRMTVSEALRLLNYGVLSTTGLFGLALALRRRVPGAWLFFWVFLLSPLPYYLVTVQARFRHPLEPLICVLTVYLFRSTEARPARNA